MRRWSVRLGRSSANAPSPEPSTRVSLSPTVPLRRAWRIYRPVLGRYRWALAALTALTISAPAVTGMTVWVFRHLVDDVIAVGRRDLFWHYALLFTAASLVASIIGFFDDLLTSWVREQFIRDARARLLHHVLRLPPHFFDEHPMGDVLARLSTDISATESVFVSAARSAISSTARIVILGGFVVALNWRLALVALLVVPPFAFTARRFSRRMRSVGRERRRRSGSVGAVAEEIVGGIGVVQAHNAEAREAARFDEQARAMVRAEMAGTRLSAAYRPLVDSLELVGGLLVVWFGTVLISRGQLTVGAMLAFLAYVTQLYAPVRGLSKLGASLQHHLAGVDRVIEFLDTPPAAARAGLAVPSLDGSVTFTDVSFSYPSGAGEALSNVSLSIERGQSVALVGPSGSGKSTIARLLLGWYLPSSGSIRVGGHDTALLDSTSLRDAISYLPQEPVLFDGTIAENIAYGSPDASRDAIEAAAVAADAAEFIGRLPDGFDTRVGRNGRLLSGGQRQRIALARAFLRDTPILVLDEPLTGLDPLTADRIVAPLHRLMAGRATLVISHHLELARDTDTVVVLDGGRVVERGPHSWLLEHGALYRRLHLDRAASRSGPAGFDPAVLDVPLPATHGHAVVDPFVEVPTTTPSCEGCRCSAGWVLPVRTTRTEDRWVDDALELAMGRLAERTWSR